MNKKHLLLAAFGLIIFNTSAQTIKFSMPEEMLQKRTSAIENAIGVLNNNYMVIESDYGKSADFNNNIRTNIRRYGTANMSSKGEVYLNTTVSGDLDEDKIIFTDVFQWGNRVVGFYTIKGKATKKAFPMYARFFDGNLKPQGKTSIDLGEMTHFFESSAQMGAWGMQSGTLINGRSKLAVRDEFQFRICNDSTRLIMLLHNDEKDAFNLKLRLYDKDLNKLKEVNAIIPIKEKKAALTDFELGNNGILYVLTRTVKSRVDRKEAKEDDDNIFEIHTINTADGTVKTKEVNISGKSLLRAGFTLDALDRPTLISMYHDNNKSKDNQAHGIYTAKLDPLTLAVTIQDQQEFDNELLIKELDEKDIKKGRGIQPVSLSNITRRRDGGLYVNGQSKSTMVVQRGSTGALNRYYTVFGMSVISYVDAEGKIRWSKGLDNGSVNSEALTAVSGAITIFRDNKLFVGIETDNGLKKKEKKRGIKFISYDDAGKAQEGKFTELPEELQEFTVVPKTVYQTSESSMMACLYHGAERGHKQMEMALMMVKF